MRLNPLGVSTWLILITAGSVFAAVGKYHLTKTVKLKGDSGWDYLIADSEAKRLYVTRGTRVGVLDLDSGDEVGEIPDTEGVHGVAIARDLGRGFTSNGRANSVTIFDLKSLKTLGKVAAGTNPDAIVYDPASKRVLAFNGKSRSVTVIDAEKGKVVGTLDLNGKPEFAAVSSSGRVFANLEDKHAIAVIDPVKVTQVAEWAMPSCEEPTGLAIDSAHHRLFSVCHNQKLVVVDSENGKTIATVPIGGGVDAAAFDPSAQLVFSSNGEGTLTVIQEETPDKFSVVENVPTQKGARTMALDPVTHRVYTISAKFAEPSPSAGAKKSKRGAIVPGSVALLILDRGSDGR